MASQFFMLELATILCVTLIFKLFHEDAMLMRERISNEVVRTAAIFQSLFEQVVQEFEKRWLIVLDGQNAVSFGVRDRCCGHRLVIFSKCVAISLLIQCMQAPPCSKNRQQPSADLMNTKLMQLLIPMKST